MNGIVRSFDDRRGYGFIRPLIGKPDSAPDLYFHASALRLPGPGRRSVPVGAEVTFLVVRGERGPQAANVQLVTVKLPTTAASDGTIGGEL